MLDDAVNYCNYYFCCKKIFKTLAGVSLHRNLNKCDGFVEFGKKLNHLYYTEKLTMEQIAKLLGCTRATIENHMRKYGFDKRHDKIPWNKGKTGRQIPWNKGLNKGDIRVLNYVEKAAITKRKKNQAKITINKCIRSMPEYKIWRQAVFERDEFKSILSGKTGTLNAHHKITIEEIIDRLTVIDKQILSNDPFEVIKALKKCDQLWDVNNGITILEEEHRMIHSNGFHKGTVIITGIQGQDGSYLAEYLLDLGYNVIGIARRKSSGETNENIKNIKSELFELMYVDITDAPAINWLLQKYKPEMYFNLAAQSHVGQSFSEPINTFKTNAEAVIILLEAVRRNSKDTKVYQAGTSELWGSGSCPIDGFNEDSVFCPRSPYAIAKAAAFYYIKNYREAYGLFCVNGILGNHSSPRRGADFATRKITKGVANIVCKQQDVLKMGNLDSFRDEGHAKDYVKAMYLMLQQDQPSDYVVATGHGATIKQMLEYVCQLANLKIEDVYVADERFMRPSDVPFLKGDSSKMRSLGWKPEYTWQSLLKEMYEYDLKLIKG